MTQDKGPFWQVLIRDNGIGIPKQMQQAVFKAFKRAVFDKEYKGLGMGLAIAQKYAHLMGGFIEIVEPEHKGTVIAVNLAKLK